MTYFLLIAILIMTGWIMITLNEVDRTNTKLFDLISRNQVKLDKKIESIKDELVDKDT